MKQLSVNGVAWSASISSSSSFSLPLFWRDQFPHVHVLIARSSFSRFVPKYFEQDIQNGVPTLTQAGRVALEAELKYEDEVADADAGERHDNGDGGSAPSPGS
jgi:hypothetical protein